MEYTDAEFAALLASPSSSTKLLVPSHTDDPLNNNNDSSMANIVSQFQSMTGCSDIDITNGVANQYLDMSDNNLVKAVELYTELHQQGAEATTNNEEEYETGSECYDISLSSPNYDYLGLDYDDDISTTTELINNLTTTKEKGGLIKEKSIDTSLPTVTAINKIKGQIDKKSTEQLDEEEYFDNDDDVIGEEYILGTMMVRVLQARNVQVNNIVCLFYVVFSFSWGDLKLFVTCLYGFCSNLLPFTHTHNKLIIIVIPKSGWWDWWLLTQSSS
jgi:hypothetical protein